MVNNTKRMRIMRIVVAVASTWAIAGLVAAQSFASAPILKLNAPTPDSISAGTEVYTLRIVVQNVGDTTTSGPITVTDTVAGLGLEYFRTKISTYALEPTSCEGGGASLTCSNASAMPPGAQLFYFINLLIPAGTTGTHRNVVTVSGGGSSGAISYEQDMTIGPPEPFGFTLAEAQLLDANRLPDTQAASDPADFTTNLRWRSFAEDVYGVSEPLIATLAPVERFKDVVAHLPPGLIGNPSATPALCTPDELAENGPANNTGNCPLDSQIGLARVTLNGNSLVTGLFNMVPSYGASAELGFQLFQSSVLLYAYVRPGDHGIDVISRDTTTSIPVSSAEITVWGAPSDPSHDRSRGGCLGVLSTYEGPNGEVCPTSAPRKAFLRTPTSCSGDPLQFGAESNSYEKPDTWIKADFTGPTMTGCDPVPFSPSITVDPTATAASSPTGVAVKLSLPQNQNPEALATADLKKAVVTLPEGMAINPSAADGLQACADAQLHLQSNAPADCPDGSKIGTVLLHTQLIPSPIEGSVFLRTQNSNDPMSGEMFRMVIELRDDAHGLDFKIPGQVQASPTTGRLTTTFDNNPQFPFEDITLKFKSGSRAPLTTPADCQTQATQAQLYPWSRPDEPAVRATSFALTSGPEDTPCASTHPFQPGFNAGVTSVQAGGFTPFLATFMRKDADQSIEGVSVKLPLGLSGSLIGLPLCPETLASIGRCEASSEIGSVTAGAGSGPTPFYVTGGKVFMTGPYKGAPFGLSIVVPAKAGPFDLGTVNVRAKVEIDQHTGQITVTSDPIPQIVSGVPVALRLVNVTINRPSFTFNPTNCDPLSVVGTLTGGQGAVARLENRFQVTNCAALRFEPKFRVSTSAKTSRANGASLHVKLTYPKGALGKDANIARVKVALPKQLPSRLTTLQKACRDVVFEANPAACPGESRVGYVTVSTPLVPVPLEGPAYFVSHGGAKFPDLVFVLQGYGITVDLVGTTFIDGKTNVTSTTFKQVPDVPVGSFELHLPSGRYSALAATGNLCERSLKMPTAFVAQDGAEIHESTPIAVSGCPQALRVLRHSVHGTHATLTLGVPRAGRLSVSGAGIATVHRRLARPGEVSLALALTAAERRFLAAHPGRRARVHVLLTLAPRHGARLRSSLTLLLG
jgi:hypothetical protein